MKRFVIRDSESKKIVKGWDGKILLDFNSLSSAKIYFLSIPFQMNLYYEIYDNLNNKIVLQNIINNSFNRRRRSSK